MRRRLLPLAALLLALAAAAPAPAPAQQPSDAYLQGYLTAILERELGWPRDSYTLSVTGGVATLTLAREDAARRAQVQRALSKVEGLQGLNLAVEGRSAAPAGTVKRAAEAAREAAGLTRRRVPYPVGDVFQPLLADVKERQFFVSFRRFQAFGQSLSPDLGRFAMASVGYGGLYGLSRRLGTQEGDGLQISLDGALFAQFNLNSASHDLINADYTVGVPVTYRSGAFSARFRLYHQSSHLGDEFLLRYKPERVNLSYEAVQLLVSGEKGFWRAYGGGEYMGDRDPATLRPWGLQAGLEYRQGDRYLLRGRFLAGLDVKSYEENEWRPSYSLKAGLEFGLPDPGRRHLRFLLEGYRGYSPYGQFYRERVQYLGFGVSFNF